VKTSEDADGPANEITLPLTLNDRCDLLVTGFPDLPELRIDGNTVPPLRTSKSKINNFADYAVAGMPSTVAKPWNMASFDLKRYLGKKIKISYKGTGAFKSFLLIEQAVNGNKVTAGNDKLWPITNNSRRQTIALINKTH
jgi:hypothetical protein